MTEPVSGMSEMKEADSQHVPWGSSDKLARGASGVCHRTTVPASSAQGRQQSLVRNAILFPQKLC